MRLDRIAKCPCCGRAYKQYSMMVGDQSACPSCVGEAEQAVSRPGTAENERRRFERWR